jgi:hypothetical protein
MDDDSLVSYSRVEIVALAIGLAMRDIWVNQFPENFSGIPPHVTNSPFLFREYEQLSHEAKTLLEGYEDLLVFHIVCISSAVLLTIISDLCKLQKPIRRRPLATRRLLNPTNRMVSSLKGGMYL